MAWWHGLGTNLIFNFSPVLKEYMFNAISDCMCQEFCQAELDSTILCTCDLPGHEDNQFVKVNTCSDVNRFHNLHKGDSWSSIGKIENDRFVLYGLASFTSDSCLSGYPNGFTEIQPHMDFILENLD